MRTVASSFLGAPMRLLVPETEVERKIGLLEHAGLSDDEGMLLAPAAAIHTMGMLFPIDVAWLGAEDGNLYAIAESIAPGLVLQAPAGAAGCLELPAGWFRRVVGERFPWTSFLLSA